MPDTNPNRIDPLAPPPVALVQPDPGERREVHTVSTWVRAALAFAIPIVGGLAVLPLPQPVPTVAALAALGLGGLAAHLGMKVGSPK